MNSPPLVVLMGVSGSGKSVVGESLAADIGVPYKDGDDLHPESNVAKMSKGVPLTDADRWPWLDRCGQWLADHDGRGGVLACSALKRVYRDRLVECAPRTRFAELDVAESVLRERLTDRMGHFMPATLLASQLATLEPLGEDEPGIRVDVPADSGIPATASLVRTALVAASSDGS